jgi:hypothetical protein
MLGYFGFLSDMAKIETQVCLWLLQFHMFNGLYLEMHSNLSLFPILSQCYT